MKQLILYILFVYFFPFTISGQEVIKPELPPIDSIDIKGNFLPEITLTNFMISGGLMIPELNFNAVKFPKFDFNERLLNFKQDYSYYIFNPAGKNNVNIPFTAFPFAHSASIFNQAAYKLSDKFLIGGNSFGSQSIFSAPLPNQGMNNFDTRGASMFFQYKVSKNFKIETHIRVTDRQF